MEFKTTESVTPQNKGRRSPTADERVRDAEASRRKLLAAALDEFSEKGYAGARVQDIAKRAGVNKQLITYYFGGKEGLYQALHQAWREREASFADPNAPLAKQAAKYLHDALADPRLVRLLVYRGLAHEPALQTDNSLGAGVARAQTRGELADDLDSRFVMVALLGMVIAPIATPQLVRQVTGFDPASAEFTDFYVEQVERMVQHLAGGEPELA